MWTCGTKLKFLGLKKKEEIVIIKGLRAQVGVIVI